MWECEKNIKLKNYTIIKFKLWHHFFNDSLSWKPTEHDLNKNIRTESIIINNKFYDAYWHILIVNNKFYLSKIGFFNDFNNKIKKQLIENIKNNKFTNDIIIL